MALSSKTLFATILVLAIAIGVSGTVVPHVGKIKSHAPRTYKVSLDDPL
jgi:hypothetical protein